MVSVIITILNLVHAVFTLRALSEQCLSTMQYFTVKCQEGVVASSFVADKKFFIDPAKLLPLERFLPKPKGASSGRGEPPSP